MTAETWLRVDDVAAVLGVARSWVYEGVASKRIPHHRVGRFVRFSPGDLKRIEAMTAIEPTRPPRLRDIA